MAGGGPSALRALDPVAFALERIAGQRDPAPRLAFVQSLEPDRQPRFPGRRNRGDEGGFRLGLRDLRPGTQETRDRGRRAAFRRCGPGHGGYLAEHRVRTDLHHGVDAQFGQGLDAGAKRDLLACLPLPVGGVQGFVRFHDSPGQVADERDGRRRERRSSERRFQVIQRRFDHGAVVGGTLPESHRTDAVRLEAPFERLERFQRTAHHLVRPVVGRDAHADPAVLRIVLFHRRRHPRRRREDRGHCPIARNRPDQRPPRGGEAQPLLQTEHTRRMGGRDLPEAVSEHDVGPDPEAGPEGGERAFEGIDGRLLPLRIVQVAGVAGTPEHHVEQRAAPVFPEQGIAAVEHRPNRRLALVEGLAHADPLAGLSGVGERHLRRGPRRGLPFASGERLQLVAQRSRVAEHDARAPVEVASTDARRPCHVRQQRCIGIAFGRVAGPPLHPGQNLAGQFAKRVVRLARERQQAGPALRESHFSRRQVRDRFRQRNRDRKSRAGRQVVRLRGGARLAVSLEHDMGVRARPAESAHARPRRPALRVRPCRGLRRHLERQPLPRDLRVRRAEVEVPGNDALVHRQQHLDDPGHPRGRFQVADVRLHRADQQRPVRIATTAIGRSHRLCLDRVAHFGARAVRFDVVDIGGRDPGLAQRGLDDLLLRRTARYGQPLARPVLVQGRAADDAPDAVAVGFRLGEPLEHDDAAAFAPDVAVPGGVEGGAAPVRRQHPGVGAQLQQSAGEDRVHPSGQREIGLAALQAGHALVDGDQGGRAGGIQRQGRPFQAEREGDPPDGGVERRAGDGVEAGGRLVRLADVEDQTAVLVVADAGIDPGPAAPQAVRIDARVFERPPAGLEHQPLLGIEHLRLDRRDAEEGGVELVEAVEIGAETAGAAELRAVREELADPADSGTRDPLADGIHTAIQLIPEGREAVRAGEPAGHADDRDRLVARRARPRCSVCCVRRWRHRLLGHVPSIVAMPFATLTGPS